MLLLCKKLLLKNASFVLGYLVLAVINNQPISSECLDQNAGHIQHRG